MFGYLLVLVDKVFTVLGDGANLRLIPITAQSLRTVSTLFATAVSQRLHHRVDVGLENLGQL